MSPSVRGLGKLSPLTLLLKGLHRRFNGAVLSFHGHSLLSTPRLAELGGASSSGYEHWPPRRWQGLGLGSHAVL